MKMLLYFAGTLIAGGATYAVCMLLGEGLLSLALRAVICLVLPNVIFALLNCKNREFSDAKLFVTGMLKRK